MAERCTNCGSELFAGQQFCRFCGARTMPLSGGETPTQILPSDRPANAPDTAPQRPPFGTDPVLAAPPTNYYQQQPPVYAPPVQNTAALAPRRRGRARYWIMAVIIIGVLGTLTLVGLISAFVAHRNSGVREVRIIKPPAMPNAGARPPAPPDPRMMVEGGNLLDEGEAEVSGDKTTLTKSFPLKAGALLSVKNLRGDIQIEGWDEPNAEVTIVKRGGTKETRQNARITARTDGKQLTLATMPGEQSDIAVDYEIKLPRNLHQIEINSMSSDVEVSNFGGGVAVQLQQGDIKLEDIGGVINTKLVNGKTVVSLGDQQLGGQASAPYNITAVNGEIELNIDHEVGADIKAEVVTGEIDVDSDLSFKVEKRAIGQHAVGRTGAGGKPIVIKAVSGKIKIH